MAVTLKDEKILDTWGLVIEEGAGRAAGLAQTIADLVRRSELPGISCQKVEAQPGMLKGLFGKKRDYMMITNEGLKDYRMYLGARDYGKHLDISWYLTVEPGFFKGAFSAMLANGNVNAMSLNLDVFDTQDLRAYMTSVHHCCVVRAVEQVFKEMGQDASKVDWRSKGILQVQ
jgi:hypothetical protein